MFRRLGYYPKQVYYCFKQQKFSIYLQSYSTEFMQMLQKI